MKRSKVVEYMVKKIAEDVIDFADDVIDLARDGIDWTKDAAKSYLHGYKDEEYEDTCASAFFNFAGGSLLAYIVDGLHILPHSLYSHYFIVWMGVTGLPFCTSYLSKKYKEALSSYSESDRNKG